MISSNVAYGGLLYLSAEEGLKLNTHLKRLFIYIFRHKQSSPILFRIRKQLLDLANPLSPLSKTKKIINEILELTEQKPTTDQTKVMALMHEIQEIYPWQPERVNRDIIQIGGY